MSFQYRPRVAALTHLVQLIRKMGADASELRQGSAHHALEMANDVERLRNAVDALGEMHSKQNPLVTPAAHVKKVNDAAAQLKKASEATLARMNGYVHSGSADIEKRIAAKVKLKPDEYAPEVRAVFRGLSHVDRVKMLQEFAVQNRGPELAAIVTAPRSLTGIDEELQRRFTRAIIETHAAPEHAEQARLMESFNAALTALDPVQETVNAYSDPAAPAEITDAEQAAAKAAQQFKTATEAQ